MTFDKLSRRNRIKHRIRKIISGTTERPRLAIFRSNKQIYAQLIDDDSGRTIVSASSFNNGKAQKGNKSDQAIVVGKELAEKAKKAGIEKIVFDRNGYLYHGRLKSLADSARKGGLKF